MRNAVFLSENEYYFPIDLALDGKQALCRRFTYFEAAFLAVFKETL
jgi:hypothetical protein